MKNRFLFFLLFILLLSIPITVYGADNNLKSINIEVELDEYGSAYIKETWTGSFPDKTENYKVMENLMGTELRDFKVSSIPHKNNFRQVNPWDIDKSRSEKAFKYGIVTTNNGYELCWGIGGFDGEVSFEIEYVLDNFVKQYSDGYSGFNWQFVSTDMSPAPKDVLVNIRLKDKLFDLEDTNIWAFGFGGEINNEDGVIVARTTERFWSSDYFTILLSVPENTFNINTIQNETFDNVKQLALQDSDYNASEDNNGYIENPNAFGAGITIVIMIFTFMTSLGIFVVPIIVITIFLKSIIRLSNGLGTIKNMPNEQQDEIPYYREIPFDNNLGLGYVTKKFITSNENYEDLISAYLLKWVKEGYLTVVEGLYKNDVKVALKVESDNVKSSFDFENKLYDMVVKASGQDRILHEEEFNNWTLKNYEYVGNVLNLYFKTSKDLFVGKGYLEEKLGKRTLTELGIEEVNKYIGFKKYLKDYSLISERGIKEVNLWEDYLIWATLYGIAGLVEQQLDVVDPTYFENLDAVNMRKAIAVSRNLSSRGVRGYYTAVERHRVSSSGNSSGRSRSSGGGGRSSRSGGGRSGGGGRGGGSR